ncbi:hypothetical protein FGG08_004344 [Glutinoglossum americanum]|uniref:Vacuolar sorting protein Vps3844 N-terminal domain-containing protein n=1 Tax=Glutinoglossum americanum TaxID=1670608 RepID=A0A9P8I0M2_9PEZI|nr:hypothetical protein FGG08_004344 [Glutinoglossum americanum]
MDVVLQEELILSSLQSQDLTKAVNESLNEDRVVKSYIENIQSVAALTNLNGGDQFVPQRNPDPRHELAAQTQDDGSPEVCHRQRNQGLNDPGINTKMRLKACLLVPAIFSSASAASSPAPFFAFENPSPPSDPQTVSPEAARLILARRLGLSQFHRLKGLGDDTLRQINDLGGSQQRLLSDPEDDLQEPIVIIVEGVENAGVGQARSSHASPDGYLEVKTSGDTFMGSIIFNENVFVPSAEPPRRLADEML